MSYDYAPLLTIYRCDTVYCVNSFLIAPIQYHCSMIIRGLFSTAPSVHQVITLQYITIETVGRQFHRIGDRRPNY